MIYSFSAASSICEDPRDISLLSLPGDDTAPILSPYKSHMSTDLWWNHLVKPLPTASNFTAFLILKALIALCALAINRSSCVPLGPNKTKKITLKANYLTYLFFLCFRWKTPWKQGKVRREHSLVQQTASSILSNKNKWTTTKRCLARKRKCS